MQAQKLLHSLEQLDRQLESLVGRAQRLEAHHNEPEALPVILMETKLQAVRRSAAHLDNALVKALGCGLQGVHFVNLLLEDCVNASGDWTTSNGGKKKPDATISFTFMFSDNPKSKSWRKAELRVPRYANAYPRE
jgi:hypothetical protein